MDLVKVDGLELIEIYKIIESFLKKLDKEIKTIEAKVNEK